MNVETWARSNSEQAREGLQATVLGAICQSGGAGMTAEEIADFLRVDIGSVTPRLKPLELAGMIERAANRRFNRSGRSASVWVRRASKSHPGVT